MMSSQPHVSLPTRGVDDELYRQVLGLRTALRTDEPGARGSTHQRAGADSPFARCEEMLRAGRHPDDEETLPNIGPTPTPTPTTTATTSTRDLAQLYATLNEYLLLEHKCQPRLNLPTEAENGEVTTGARDGAAHVLRCLKVWFDLPAEVLINAINLFDRFLTKMKVRPCHVPCITVACMNIAVEQWSVHTSQPRGVTVDELVSISQSACTAGDVVRMCGVVSNKLGLSPSAPSLTALHWLRLLRELIQHAAAELGLPPVVDESELSALLEIAVCDAECANARLSELALVLLYYKLEQQMQSWAANGSTVPENAYYLFEFGAQLQAHCRMSDASLVAVGRRVRWVISRYEARTAAPHRQRLVWRLSSRTLKVLRPTDRLGSLLPTIEEQNHLADSPPRNRSGSESSESEETSDWPRSPVLPVYCDN